MTDQYFKEQFLAYEERFTNQGVAELWIKTIQENYNFSGGNPPIALSISGNTTYNPYLDRLQLRPATGYYARSENLIEGCTADAVPKKQSTSSVPHRWTITNDQADVTGKIIYSLNPILNEYFELGNKNQPGSKVFIYGGFTEREHLSILIIRHCFDHIPQLKNVVKCKFYQRGIIMPAVVDSSSLGFSTVDFTFKPAIQYKENGDCEDVGSQLYYKWYVKLNNDGTNTLLDPIADIFPYLKDPTRA